MKTRIAQLAAVLSCLLLIGCATHGSSVNTKKGAVTGGALGAIAGGIIGHQSGRGLEGAAIGAGVGALGGGVLGSAADENESHDHETDYE